jgi:hypothetical protein
MVVCRGWRVCTELTYRNLTHNPRQRNIKTSQILLFFSTIGMFWCMESMNPLRRVIFCALLTKHLMYSFFTLFSLIKQLEVCSSPKIIFIVFLFYCPIILHPLGTWISLPLGLWPHPHLKFLALIFLCCLTTYGGLRIWSQQYFSFLYVMTNNVGYFVCVLKVICRLKMQ